MENIQNPNQEVNKPEQNEQTLNEKKFTVWIVLAILGASTLLLSALIVAGTVLYTGKIIISKIDKLSVNNGSNQAVQKFTPPTLGPNAPILGNSNAKVTIIEFADFQCPFCKRFFDTIFPQIKTQYIDTGKVKFSYQDFAFLGPESQSAAEAAKCSQDQNKFWEYHDSLYKNQGQENSGTFSDVNLKKFGATLGLDTIKFNQCVDSHIHKPDVDSEVQSGTSAGVQATPTMFINDQKLEGVSSFAEIQAIIEKELSK